MMSPIRVVIADDHPVVRTGICSELKDAEIDVVAQASNGEQALEMVETEKPDVLILDIEMPVMGGLEAARRALKAHPEMNILLLSAYSHETYIFGALKLGVKGYVLKEEALDTIAIAVKTVAKGDTWLSPRVADRVVFRALKSDGARHPELTPIEIDILDLLAEGKTDKEIGEALGFSERSVRYHLKLIQDKTGTENRLQAVLWAAEQGLVQKRS